MLLCYSIYILIHLITLLLFLWPADSSIEAQHQDTLNIYVLFQPHAHTHTLKSHHLKQVYTIDCSIKGTFDAQSKATSVCCSATVCSKRSLSSGISIQKRAPCACLCFPNHSHTGNQTPAFRGKQKPPLSFSTTWSRLKVCASSSCSCQSCPEKCLTACCDRALIS